MIPQGILIDLFARERIMRVGLSSLNLSLTYTEYGSIG